MTIKELIASKLRPIGDAIREKDGSTELIPIDDMPQAIRDIQGGGGGIVEVTELPEVGEENTVYKLVSKPTQVPNSGYVKKVYINTSLSKEELYSLFDSLTFVEVESDGKMYYMLASVTDSQEIFIAVQKTDTSYVFMVQGTNYMFGFDESMGGWFNAIGENIPNVVEINGEVMASMETISIGTENDKITSLFSTTPFSGESDYYIYDKVFKPFPNKGTISEIYFNTDLSVEEVVAELSKLTLDEDGIYVLGGSFETPCLLYITYDETAGWTIQDVFKSNIFFTSTYWDSINSAGWNHNLIKDGKYTFDEPIKLLTYNDDGDIVGSENWKITNVVRVFENKWTKISGANIVRGGTAVPNSGYVDTVYFNTEINENDIQNLIDTLPLYQTPFFDYPVYPLLFSSDFEFGIMLSVVDDDLYGKIYMIAYANAITNKTTILYYKTDNSEQLYTPLTTEELEIHKEVIAEYSGLPIGTENDKLANLISSTPFENKVIKELSGDYEAVELEVTENTTVDVGAMLDEGKMPLSVKVNIGSTNIVSQDGEIIKTLKGDYEAINLTFNEPPSFWQETVFVNGNYVEKLYFNTELTTDEIDAIFSTLTYDDNSHLITQYATAEAGRSGSIYIIKMETNGLNGYTIRISNFDGDSYIYASNQEIADYIKSNYNKSVEVGLNITEFPINNTIHTVSNEISNLTNLISSKPPLKNTINVESYLDNKQMPMSVTVNVEPNLQEKEVTENGEYVADEGYDGFSKVTVNVASSGEDMLQARVDATNMCDYLFYKYKGSNVDYIANLNTSKVTNMSYMFSECKNLTTIPQLNTSKVTNMQHMFSDCHNLTTIPQLDTSNVTSMANMLTGCNNLTTIPQLNTSKVTNMSYMFSECKNLTTIPQLNIKKRNN